MNKTKKRKTRRRIAVRPIRLLVYLLFFLFASSSYAILKNAFWFQASVLLLAFFGLSVFFLFCQSKCLEIRMEEKQKEVRNGGKAYYKVSVVSKSLAPVSMAQVILEIGNRFYYAKSDMKVKMPVRFRGESQVLIPLTVTRNGIIKLQAEWLELQDLLGILIFRKELGLEREVAVFPSMEDEETEQEDSFKQAYDDLEEMITTGNSSQDMGEFRKYVPGDRPKDIHWKLSAKKQELLVRVKEETAKETVFVVLGFSEKEAVMDDILSTCYRLCAELVAEERKITLFWSDASNGTVEKRILQMESDLQEAYMDIYQQEFYARELKKKETGMKTVDEMVLFDEIRQLESGVLSCLLISEQEGAAGVRVIQDGMEKER